jgi:hypothetical protein
MDNWTVFQKWGGGMIFVIATYDVLLNQLVPQDIRGKYLLYSFGWSWQTWTIILLGSLVVTYWWNNRKKEKGGDTRSNSSSGNSIAMQGVKDSPVVKASGGGISKLAGRDYFDRPTFVLNPATTEYEHATPEQLKVRIGRDTYSFVQKLNLVPYAHERNQEQLKAFDEAVLEFNKITNIYGLANIVLAKTSIPHLIVEVSQSFSEYGRTLQYMYTLYERKLVSLRDRGKILKGLEKEIEAASRSSDSWFLTTCSLADMIIKSCKE